MKQIVNYHNDFNKISLPSFTAQEQNILMGIICKIKDRKSDENIEFYADELLEFSTENLTKKALAEIIKILKEKFFKADFTILERVPELRAIKNTTFNLFSEFTIYIDEDNGEDIINIELGVNPRFAYLINDLTKHFTSFELKEFIGLSGKYSKTLYRLLKQFRNTGKCTIYSKKWDEFREYMDIPESYQIRNIDQRILKPSIKELSAERDLFNNKKPIFENLTYKKIKDPKGRGRGGKVIGIEFYFTPEPNRSELQEQIKDLKSLDKHIEQLKEQEAKQLKFNPLTGKPVNWADEYMARSFRVKNKYDGGYDTCKIKSLLEQDNKIFLVTINQENLKDFNMQFESQLHFKNWFEKVKLY
ncbi:TPA: replication initiation protein [Campylobacter fetus subsp. venerealis]|nr:replication initiation protein [Campylobacter fetus subsp. venerealis]